MNQALGVGWCSVRECRGSATAPAGQGFIDCPKGARGQITSTSLENVKLKVGGKNRVFSTNKHFVITDYF